MDLVLETTAPPFWLCLAGVAMFMGSGLFLFPLLIMITVGGSCGPLEPSVEIYALLAALLVTFGAGVALVRHALRARRARVTS